jgi:hypothetical protein
MAAVREHFSDERTSANEAKMATAMAESEKAKAEAAKANEHAAQLALDLEKERRKTAPRPWTKEQFDAIQSMKGQIAAVAVLAQKDCVECGVLAHHLVTAFHEAGAEIYVEPSLNLGSGTGIFVYSPPGISAPENDPVFVALKRAGLNPIWLRLDEQHEKQYSIRIDIPIIIVGERFLQYLEFPYFPPTNGSYHIHHLKK